MLISGNQAIYSVGKMVDVAQLFRWRCGVESPKMVNKGRKHAHAMGLFLQLFDG